ncbi:MAG: hypothetical protein GX625_08080 [Clostridiaceae bacterium]|nr:hypothetical protein [Clostridiaceae bacterium]
MFLQASSLQGRNIANYSMYMNMNTQAGSLREPVNSPAQNNNAPEIGNLQKTTETTECQTCKSRKYVDKSDDPGVSFQSPTGISPGASFAAVSSHEQEHVSREQANASRNDRKVVSQTVQIYIDTCPECGRAYSSGGKTTTVTKGESRKPDYFMDKMNKFFEGHFGKKVDTYV